MFSADVTSHSVTTDGHITHYLAAGPEQGPLIIFVHGWPELSISWRHQLPVFAGLGFRVVAPDMRGYGLSSVYPRHEDYRQELIVRDMMGLLRALKRPSAVWVGHDWGSPVVWNIACHHPEACRGVASLCVPYYTLERGLVACLPLINRDLYPKKKFPAGQWEYMRYYEEHFETACRAFEANPYNTARLLFRKGDPSGMGKPAGTAMTRINGGWFGDGGEAPAAPIDTDVLTEADLDIYAESLKRNGFFGPDSWYMNHERNASYADTAVNDGYLDMPVLFLGARYDYVCDTMNSDLAEPMRERCQQLDEAVIDSGHWMAQEKPAEVSAAIARWLASNLGDIWPAPRLR